ncbi:MAG: hypothetical protein ABIB47_04860 [Candidatus Woesearchaeota archaeon]
MSDLDGKYKPLGPYERFMVRISHAFPWASKDVKDVLRRDDEYREQQRKRMGDVENRKGVKVWGPLDALLELEDQL